MFLHVLVLFKQIPFTKELFKSDLTKIFKSYSTKVRLAVTREK